MSLTSRIACLALIFVIFASLAATAYASTTVSVYVRSIPSGLHGHVDGNYWVGQIPISVNGEQTYAYCMNYTKEIYSGASYLTTLATPPNNQVWKSISYILTWYNPPTTDGGAVASQVAIWQLLSGSAYAKPSWLTTADNDLGSNLVMSAAGKDVIRQTDTLTWTAPSGLVDNGAVAASPGTSKYFEVQITDNTGVGRPGVKITFAAPPLLSPTDVFTDSNGKAGITVNIPTNELQGSTVDIQASTRGTYPVLYLDLNNGDAQDLIGVDTTYDLTLDARAVVVAHINFVPEIEFGTIAAVSMMALGFIAWGKKTKRKP